MSENELLAAHQKVLAAMASLRAAEQCASGQELIDTMMFHRHLQRQSQLYPGVVGDDTWAGLADKFADEAYASVKGHVRTYVLHQQLPVEQLPEPTGHGVRCRWRCGSSIVSAGPSRLRGDTA